MRQRVTRASSEATRVSEAQAVPARISPTAVFKKRDFVLMWMAQLVSTAGSALTDLAAGIYVYDQTGSAFLVGVTLMATAVPSLIVGLIAGVFVDRWDRRRVMMASNLLQAVVVATIPFLLGIDITLLFVAILVNAGVKQFFDPAYEALIPEIASDEELTAANAFLQIASFGSTAIGFAGAGLLAAIDIRLGVLDRLADVRVLGGLHLPHEDAGEDGGPRRGRPRSASSSNNLKIGVRTIRDTPMLRSLFLLGAPVFFAFGLWNVLLLPMAITRPGRLGVRVRDPGGPDVDRVRAGQPVHGQLRGPAPDRACGSSSGTWAWASPGSCTACRPTILIAHRLGHGQRLLQLALGRRAPDAAPAAHPARAARPRVLGPVRDARRDLPGRHGGAPAWRTCSMSGC